MHLYRADESKVNSPIPFLEELVVGWLESNAENLGSIDFEAGECFAFFKSLYLLCGVDLLSVIGGSVHEAPAEEEYCCGSIGTSKLESAVDSLCSKIKESADGLELPSACTDYMQTQGISEEWLLQVLKGFLQMLQDAGNCTVIGLFE